MLIKEKRNGELRLMEEYYGIVPERTPERKMGLAVIGAIVLFLSIKQENFLYVIIAVLMLSTMFYRKEHIVNENGTDIAYIFFGMPIKYHWDWSEISAIAPDYKKAAPNVFMEINRGVTIRAFVFTKGDALKVLALAKRMNPDMYVDDRSEEEKEEAERMREERIAAARKKHQEEKKARRKR